MMVGLGIIEIIVLAVIASAILLALIVAVVSSMRPQADPKREDGTLRLVRMPQRGMLGGVCAGFAYKMGIAAWIVRVLLILLVFASGMGVIAYLLLWIFMPKATHLPNDYEERAQ